ncbi:hypothetical protein NFI96_018620 [Prochilodus magdalenae]|nr:hypothetical protein NFI96_018620 [Prochilodus magdalenae]
MDPSAPPADWNPGEKSGGDQPPPYQDHNAGYSPIPPSYSNQADYPQAQPYGVPYGQPHGGQCQGPLAGQPTVTVQPTVFVNTSLAQPLPDYLGYSIFTMLCCCLPLGIGALVYSINTRDANMQGRRAEAERNSRMALTLNNVALGMGIVIGILYVIFLFRHS